MRTLAPKTTATLDHHPLVRRHSQLSQQPRLLLLLHSTNSQRRHFGRKKSFGLSRKSSFCSIHTVNGGASGYVSPLDDKPFETLPGGERLYLDEQDVVTFLDPPIHFIPLDPTSFNAASYVWKKIEDVPEERRHRLLHLMEPRVISRAWEIAGTRYENPKLAVKISECNLLANRGGGISLETYNCRTSEGPIPWINFFKTAMFSCGDGNIYGRFIGGSFLEGLASRVSPLYFIQRDIKQVMATEQPCDCAFEFGEGAFDLPEYPKGFPRPAKHPYPFNDEVVVYVRHLGPGVAIGQAWQEGKAIEQVPRKLCSEILMVKHYASV